MSPCGFRVWKVCWHLTVRGTGFGLVAFRKSAADGDVFQRKVRIATVGKGIWCWHKDSRKPSETGWNVEISASSKIYRLRWKLDSKGMRKVYEIKKFSSNVLFGTGPVWKAVGRTVCSILMVNAEKHTLSSSSILSRAVGAAPLPSLPCRWWGFPSSSLFTHTHTKKNISFFEWK